MFKRIGIITLALLLLFVNIVRATTDNIEVEKSILANGQKIVIKGTTLPNSLVFLTVLNKNYDFSQLKNATEENLDTILKYVEETNSDSSGIFTFDNFFHSDDDGEYLYRIRVGETIIKDSKLIIFSNAKIDSFFSNMSSLTKTSLIDNMQLLGLNEQYFNIVFSEDISNTILKLRQNSYTVNQLEPFKKDLISESFDDVLTRLSNDNLLMVIKNDLIYNYLELNNLSQSIIFKNYEDIDKLKVLSRMKNEKLSKISSVSDYFSKSVILTMVENAVSWETIGNIISDNSSIISSYSSYEELSPTNKISVQQSIYANRNFSSFDLFNITLANLINNFSIVKPPVTPGGNGGGMGGVTVNKDTGITPIPIPITKTDIPFTDINNVEWAKEGIRALYLKKIINGKSENEFAPNDYITKEEFVKMLVTAFEIQAKDETINFSDVTINTWYYPYIVSAYSQGLVKGLNEIEFGIGKPLNREELTTLAYRTILETGFLYDNIVNIPYIDDNDISDYAKDAVKLFSNYGIVKGVGNNLFAPKELCTRAQAAKILYECLNIDN